MAEGASEQELAENRTEQTSHVVSKLTAQDVLGLSVDQLKAELLSRGVSVTSRIAKRDLQTRLCGLLSAEQEHAETQSVESDASVQLSGDEDDLRSSASLAPPSPKRTEVTFKTLPTSVAGLTADQIFELERMRIQMQMRQVEINSENERRRIEIENERERRQAEMQHDLEL
jgi:hypothetical protein